MKCSKAHKLISPYIDGELTGRDIKTVEDHIKVCHKCRKEFEDDKEIHTLFANADKFKAPYGFHTRVMANLSSGRIKESSKIPLPVRLVETVVVIVVIALGLLSGSFLIKGYMPDRAKDVMASLSLDVFDPAPPDSLAGAYLAMTEVKNEK